MDITRTDEQIRDLYQESAAPLDKYAFQAELVDSLPSRQKRRPSRGLHVASFAALGVVLLVAAGFGLNALVEKLGQDNPIIVITDDSMGAETGTTPPSSVEQAQYVSVVHPYHSEYLDAPNYLIPTEVNLASGTSLPSFPESVPAQKIASEQLPQTDLALAPSPSQAGRYSWYLEAAEEPPGEHVTLGSQDVAVETARGFLVAHGLWSDSYREPEVSVGSSESGPAGEFITSWNVRFPGETVTGGMEQSVGLRVGHENRVMQLRLFIPRLEVLKDKYIRLRPAMEVIQDLDAWQDGHPSSELQDGLQGPVSIEVKGVTLAYVDSWSGGEPIAVPVYRFDVKVRSINGTGSAAGTWEVVAAADVSDSAYTTTTTPESPTTTIIRTSTSTTQVSAEFAGLMAAWQTKGITPISVGHDESEANAIFVKLPAEDLNPPDGVFASHQLDRQAFLVTHEQDLPFNRMSVYRVAADGTETMHYGISLQAGMSFQAEWETGEVLEWTAAAQKVSETMLRIGEQTRPQVSTLFEAPPDGRTLEVTAWLPPNGVAAYQDFLNALIPTIEQLNREGCRIAVLDLLVNDVDIRPVLRSAHDFQLGYTTSWWDGEDYVPPWVGP